MTGFQIVFVLAGTVVGTIVGLAIPIAMISMGEYMYISYTVLISGTDSRIASRSVIWVLSSTILQYVYFFYNG